MVEKIVILKVIRAFFGKKEPVEVMVGLFEPNGRLVGSQLLSAILFDTEVREGDSINFKTTIYTISSIEESANLQ